IAIAAEILRGQDRDSCCQPAKRLVSGPGFCLSLILSENRYPPSDQVRGQAFSGSRSDRAGAQGSGMASNNGAVKLIAGNSNPVLAVGIGAYIGLPLTKAVVRRFADM